MSSSRSRLVLGVSSLFIGFTLAHAQEFRSSEVTKPTGHTTRIQSTSIVRSSAPGISVTSTGNGGGNTNAESESVELLQPLNLEVPTFASDFTSAVMTEEMAAQMDARYIKQMHLFVTATGMEMVDSDPLARDRGANRPMMLPLAAEIQMRHEMAVSLKTYMLARGVPRFLGSREETKAIAQAYQGVQNATRFESKSAESNWTRGMGINPFESKLWANYHNDNWKLEVLNEYNNRVIKLSAVRTWARTSVESNYFINSKVWQHVANYRFSPTLTGRANVDMPLATRNPTTVAGFEKQF